MYCCQRTEVRSRFKKRTMCSLFALIFVLSALALPQDVLTYHNTTSRTGQNNHETILTPANVNSATFGRLFTLPVDGKVDAQPLYLSAVTVSGVIHNLLIVATEHDSVYAFDADTGLKIWQVRTLKSGETTSDPRNCDQVVPEIGVTATPVITRPKGSNPVIYVVAMSKDSSGNYHQRLHALDATTGGELHNGPVEIQAKYPGTGDNSQNGYVIFDPSQYKERAALLLTNGTIYLAWSSHCDSPPYTGWIMGYSQSLAQTTVLNVTPNGSGAGLWGSGCATASDPSYNIFVLAGNGDFDTTLNSSGFPADGDYGNGFLRVVNSHGLEVADYWEMDNQAAENGNDLDLGSGGPLLVNVRDLKGNLWQLGIGAGKDGNLYVVDRTNMGKFNPGSNAIYQELDGVLPGGIWSTPAFSTALGLLYYGPVGSPIFAFQFHNAKLLPNPVAQTANSFGYPGASPSLSSNGSQNGIVWAAENSSPAVLHAYNGLTLKEIYNSNQAANGRDHFGNGNKFITPTIANGKVYVGTTNSVGVFGLLK